MNLHQLTKLSRCLQWYFLSTAGTNYVELQNYLKGSTFRSSRREVLLKEGVLKLCSIFTGEHTYRSVISIKLLSNFIEILYICCIFSEHLFPRTPLDDCFSTLLLMSLPSRRKALRTKLLRVLHFGFYICVRYFRF